MGKAIDRRESCTRLFIDNFEFKKICFIEATDGGKHCQIQSSIASVSIGRSGDGFVTGRQQFGRRSTVAGFETPVTIDSVCSYFRDSVFLLLIELSGKYHGKETILR